jgi:hypothetical protein
VPEDPGVPPDDPDDWTAEQWMAYLQATNGDEAGQSRYANRFKSRPATMVGNAMLAMHDLIYGPVEEPEFVIESKQDGDDDDIDVKLDAADPSASSVTIKKPLPPPR